MTEAIQRILEVGFSDNGLHKVQVCHKENNLPSQRVIEKIILYTKELLEIIFVWMECMLTVFIIPC
ncbi:hypothetical protein NRIC_14790 [Enterococcus florum]|uniref:N-acetyltransferase domain-containing protein n=2 Tax=Enterococcus florum TaxID=2480627 RepID=A0A4P5PCA4_9ENTE|nr:hypothetical protein NRIC_14790 [Enterococcus florum]